MSIDAMMATLKSLKLFGMAQSIGELASTGIIRLQPSRTHPQATTQGRNS